MSALPVAPYLIDFGRDGDIPLAATATVPCSCKAEPDDDGSAVGIEAAHAIGLESGRAAAQAQFDRRLEEQKAAYEVQLAAARHAWASEEGARLAEQLTAGMRQIESMVADTVARILRPFLTAEVRRQAIAGLRAELEIVLQKDAGIAVSIAGPDDLLSALREQLAGRVEAVTYLPGPGIDVRIDASGTVLETRLGTWLETIEGAMR